MKTIAIIPARYASTRFPGKPLAILGGKPVIQRVYEQACEVLDEAGVDGNYTFHSWRHTVATRMAASGVGVETRKRILGHTRDETAARYDHDEHLGEVRAAIEAAAHLSAKL